MRIALALALAISVCASPALARADTEFAIGSTNRALRAPSADAVTPDSLLGGSISLAHAIDIAPAPAMRVWVEAAFSDGEATGSLFQTMTTEVHGLSLTGGARLRYAPYQHLAVSARVAFGSERAYLKVSDAGGHAASDHGWGGVAIGALSTDLLAADSARFSFGLRAELGYVAASPVSLSPSPEHDGDMLRLPMTATSFGHLDLSGPYFTFGIVAAF
jgi:hypothetical protein